MAIGGIERGWIARATGPLLTSSPSLPYEMEPPAHDAGALDEWAIVWLTLQAIEMIIRGWLLPIG